MSHLNKRHLVILLHGIKKSKVTLQGLEKFIANEGFNVLNITYPSTKYPLEELIEILHERISTQIINYQQVSFVGFSFGGLVIRAYLNKYQIQNLAKVVMVGTPNKGSEVADFFKNFRFYNKLFGPAGNQLISNLPNAHELFGATTYECGIISGNLPLDFCFPLMRNIPSDGKVSIESTKLDNMKDHIVLKVSHWFMPYSRQVWQCVVNFLKHSNFLYTSVSNLSI